MSGKMSVQNWASMLKARVGQRSINVMQIMLIVSLGSVVLLRDSLGVGIDITLNTVGPVEDDAIELQRGVVDVLAGPKRNIASVEEKNGGDLETVQDLPYEQQPAGKRKKPRGQVVDDKLHKEEEAAITEFDKARKMRGRPRGKDVSKALKKEEETTAEVKEAERMFLTVDQTTREFTIPEDLQDLQPEEPMKDKKVKPTTSKKGKKQKEKPKQALDGAIEEVLDEPDTTNTESSVDPKPPLKEPVFSGKPFSFGKTPQNWDQQRVGWLEKYPWTKTTPNGKPRMLLITGSSPWACKNPVGDHVLLKSLKNKIDYTRQHEIELFYNIAHLERNLTSYWAKLPIIRNLMLNHPEIEWFFWVDADAIFTDMLFEIPLEKYDGYNIVMWGWEESLYKNRSWVAINDGAFLFRNCQWSLDLMDTWAPMGPEGDVRNKWGEFFSEYMAERPVDFPADDQSALVYLILNKPELQSKIKLEWEYELSGYWPLFVEKFEEFMTTPGNHPGSGGKTWPFITHFTGCQPCTGKHNPKYSGDECAMQMERAYNFADNQVLQTMGFMHETLNSSHLKKVKEQDDYSIVASIGPDTWTSALVSHGL